ncbi:F-box/LRR-repeat protein 14 [Histomonas meleagridis]|nr:F-box/LRR-repeat protein 14 [Histomonas meleagridis]
MEITSQEFDLSNQSFWAAVTFERIQKSLNPNLVLINLSTNHVNYESAELLSNLMIESKTLLYLNLTETHLVRRSSDIIFEALGDSSILEFYADDNIFYDESCQKLGESLQKNPPLQLLSLCGCDISSKGCISIVKGISKDSKITDLRLESNSLFDYGATEVANIIPASNLTLLSIADNEIWSEGTNNIIKAVRGSTITALDLSYNVVDLKNLTSLLVDFDNIQAISISGCKVSEKDFPTFISSLPKTKLRTLILESLNFQPIPIS